MTPVYVTNFGRVDARRSAPPVCSARLSLKPSTSARGALDGAWWPGSTDPVRELTALIKAVGAQRAPLRRIALNIGGWDSAPRRLWLDSGRKVAVDWFRTSGVHLVRILYTDDHRIDLLLIPRDTEEATAQLALTMVTDGQDPDLAATVG